MIFPVIPKSNEAYVSVLFWHSIVMTSTTPLSRLFQKHYNGKLVLSSIANHLGISQALLGRRAQENNFEYPPSHKIDRAFTPHAFFGIIWILMAYLHICRSNRLRSSFAKRALGYMTALAFVLHTAASLNCLFINPMDHHPLPWFLLLSNLTVSTSYFILGLIAVWQRDVSSHKDAMMRCFLYSIEGAGTIRTVGSFMHLLGMGPTYCQTAHGALASSCVFSYVQRLIGIRLLTLCYIGVYAKIADNRKTWSAYKAQAASTLIFSFSVIVSFCIIPDVEQLWAMTLSPDGNNTVAIFVALVIGLATLQHPNSPKLQLCCQNFFDSVSLPHEKIFKTLAGQKMDRRNSLM